MPRFIQNPTISVIIPVRNGGATLKECLNSVLNQSIPIHQCIVVDNNSDDDTAHIVRELQREHTNLSYLLETRKGRGAARNAGIFASTGEIIVMTDADCIVQHDWVEKITAPIISGEEGLVVGGEYDLIENYWSRNTQKMYEYLLKENNVRDRYTPFIDTKNFAVHAPLMKDFPFDPRFQAEEDEELMFRLRPIVRFRYMREVKVGHRHAQSLMSVMKSAYSRSYWFAQIYHKFKGRYDARGRMLFEPIPVVRFYLRLLSINFNALRAQGIEHLLYFLVYDLSWKVGSAIGFARMDSSLRDS